MQYYSTSEISKRWNISARRAAKLASEGRIEGAFMVGKSWMIPADASKPEDGRMKAASSAGEDRFVFPDLIFGISSKDDPGNLPPDEKQLYEGILQLCRTEYRECIRTLMNLLKSTDRPCLKIGACYYLQVAYISEWQFEKASEMIDMFDSEIASARQHYPELFFMKQQMDCFRYGNALISKPFDIDIDYHCSKGFLPFLAEENAYSDLSSLYTNEPRNNAVSHEIICMDLENRGYYYAALLIHFYIAIMYSIAKNDKKSEMHLKKSVDLALAHECYAPIAFYLWFYPDFIPVLRKYYPQDTVDMLRNASIHRIDTYKAFLKYSVGSELLLRLTEADLRLISRAKAGYSIRQMAEFDQVSVSAVKQRLNKLYKKMNVKNKKEMIIKYHNELLELGN